ncbi:uncharacterized protein LOC127082296 [Lathyrus oleraceus]|uniref:uncharacterized protein LOC127082296 n=1 Tax=Pisum sativum TaxID=3888 RepID=UPI0021D3CF49|nr:uncharacterized protein LOC127082296 [Pisum sativum]
MGPPLDRLPPWYNPNAHCPFHEGAPEHDLEGCYALKLTVRELIDSKIFSFRDMGPNVENNPIPPHGDPKVNAIEDASDGGMVEKVDDVKTPLAAFHARLLEVGLIDACHDNCEERLVPANSHLSPVEICMPTPFSYESTKVVPWRYEVIVVDKIVEGSADGEVTEDVNEDVTNITGMSRMTCSGQIYTPEFNVTPKVPVKESTVIAPTKEPEVVQSEDAVEFLKLIKRSDYKVVDQLHQTPSKISILSLLLNSQAHREALLKVLAQAHVTQSIPVDQLDGVVANITACNTLSFSGEELPEDGQNHNRALHISVKCKDDALVRVLVDTGSSLNVMPKRTLAKLSYQGPTMKPNALIVKAFDGSRRTVIREVELPILIGPHIIPITFQIMDINLAYSCLLARPWIHAAGNEEYHMNHLKKLFEHLRKFRLRLNSAKCTFGVRSGKLLDFIVSQQGIEVDPDKVRAIQEMSAPRTEREVRGLLGCLNYISRFISHMTAMCDPIFKLLRKDQAIE